MTWHFFDYFVDARLLVLLLEPYIYWWMLFVTVVYDDEAVQKLLDRSQEGEIEKEKEFGMNEYLRSFKVASYQVKEGIDEVSYWLVCCNWSARLMCASSPLNIALCLNELNSYITVQFCIISEVVMIYAN